MVLGTCLCFSGAIRCNMVDSDFCSGFCSGLIVVEIEYYLPLARATFDLLCGTSSITLAGGVLTFSANSN